MRLDLGSGDLTDLGEGAEPDWSPDGNQATTLREGRMPDWPLRRRNARREGTEMRPIAKLLTVFCVLAFVVGLCGCHKVTGGGQMTTIGTWDQVGLYRDFDGDGSWDLGEGVYADDAYARSSFGFTAQPADDPTTPSTHEAKGQFQLVDHDRKIIAHCDMEDDSYWYYNNDISASFSGWSDGCGTLKMGGQEVAIDQLTFEASTGHWALFDHSVPTDKTKYPKWPYLPILEEGYGDTLCVDVYYDDFDQSLRWIGVVENGNITVHKAK